MLSEETKRKLRILNLNEVIEEVELQDQDPDLVELTFDERIQMLTDSLYQHKYNEKVQGLIKRARFRIPKADIHDVYYDKERSVKRSIVNELGTCQFVEKNQSVIIQGFTSSGKTFLGCALGKEACRHQFRTKYMRVPDLLMEFDERSLEVGGKERILKKYSSFKVLILDEWLIKDISKQELEFLFELSERRYDNTSTIFCTLYRKEDWIKRLGKGAMAESIAERYEHNVVTIETGEMNMRAIYASRS